MTDEERDEIATEMMLHALGAAADHTSYGMLVRLLAAEASVDELMAATGLGRLAVLERVGRLAAAGLVSRESGRVEGTRLALGLVGLLERVRTRFAEKIEERLPALAEGKK